MRKSAYLPGVDARMLFNSGIGTVLRNILKRMGEREGRVLVANDVSRRWCETWLPGWEIRSCTSSIYSIKEQLEVPRLLSGTSVAWSPHYNVPVLAGPPLITTVHDVLHLAHPEMFPSLVKQGYARALLQAAAKRSRRVLCVSEFTAGEFRKFTGCNSAKIEVVYNGVDAEWFQPPVPSSRPGRYFVYVGNVKPHKNLIALLKAFSRLAEKTDHRLVIVGKKDGFITGDARVEEFALQLGDRVRFTGWVDDEELRTWVAEATALVFPSLYEGFGLPPLEAMASGVPVLASKAASIPEICGDAAIYFDPLKEEDLVEKLLDVVNLSPSDREAVVMRGRKRALQFSWDNTARRTNEILRQASG